MGRRGPAPKPTVLKLIDGTRTSRVNQHEPVARDRLPICPDGVSDDVRAVWDATLVELVAMKVASSADRDSIVCYCEAVVSHRRASAHLASSDVLIVGTLGKPAKNPAVQVQRDAAYLIRSFAQEFGLTPSARTRIEVRPDDTGDNPFAG